MNICIVAVIKVLSANSSPWDYWKSVSMSCLCFSFMFLWMSSKFCYKLVITDYIFLWQWILQCFKSFCIFYSMLHFLGRDWLYLSFMWYTVSHWCFFSLTNFSILLSLLVSCWSFSLWICETCSCSGVHLPSALGVVGFLYCFSKSRCFGYIPWILLLIL